MFRDDPNQASFLHTILYSKISENNILKKIDSAINWNFLKDYLLESSCCKQYGRTVQEQEVMLRILFLKHLYKLSDEKVMEELGIRMDYKWFVGLNPEDALPETSLLTEFRAQRLKGTTMDAIMAEILRQCAEKGLVKNSNSLLSIPFGVKFFFELLQSGILAFGNFGFCVSRHS